MPSGKRANISPVVRELSFYASQPASQQVPALFRQADRLRLGVRVCTGELPANGTGTYDTPRQYGTK